MGLRNDVFIEKLRVLKIYEGDDKLLLQVFDFISIFRVYPPLKI